MDSRTLEPAAALAPASAVTSPPEAVEFVRFCRHRRSVGWPELYDEMCAVAGRGLFRGWGADELSAHGIGFSLFDMPRLAVLVQRVIADENVGRVAPAQASRPVKGPLPVMAANAPANASADGRVEGADATAAEELGDAAKVPAAV